MNCTNLQQFITTLPKEKRKKKKKKNNKRCTDMRSHDSNRQLFFLGKLRDFFVYFFVFWFCTQIKKQNKKTKDKSISTDHGNCFFSSFFFFFFLPKQLWSLPTLPPTKWLHLWKKNKVISVKR